MEVTVKPNTLEFSGILSEKTSLDNLLTAFEMLKKQGATPPIILDFSQVNYANSAGIVTWLRFAQKTASRFRYINVPTWLVSQFNMLKGFFDNGSFVDSLSAPFFAPTTQESKIFILQIGTDVPILNDYSKYNVPERVVEGKVYECDFTPEAFFSFIAANYEKFKVIPK